MKLLLKIAFDGAGFHGFQAQPSQRTVQGVLTDTMSSLFGEKMNMTGCSRTDAGVHAEGFAVAAEPASGGGGDWLRIPVSKFHRAANNVLPRDISVLGAFIVDDGEFHPRYSVVSKEYVYRISDAVTPSPFLAGRVYEYGKPISDDALGVMNDAAAHFTGKHDFTAFMVAGSKITDAVRTVFSAGVKRRADGIVEFTVSADGFLYNMVRIMAGTLIDAAEGRLFPEDIDGVISSRDRSRAGATLVPDGLYLKKVTYPFEIDWQAD